MNTFGFTLITLYNLINIYLTNWEQKTKINNSASFWKDKVFEVPQESILGSILFNIFIADLFLITNNIGLVSYADDDTIYFSNNCVDDVMASMRESVKNFFNNQMEKNFNKSIWLSAKG